MNYNAFQRKAVSHGQGPALILAGPGSGKTAVIAGRTQHLIQKLHIPAQKILVVTFSVKAAENMKERFFSLCPSEEAPCFGTLHSLCFRILRQAYPLKSENVISNTEKKAFLSSAAASADITADEDLLRTLEKEISYIKNGSADRKSVV